MDDFSADTVTRIVLVFLMVTVVGVSFTAAGIGGLTVPLIILGVGVSLARYRVMPDRWHVSDQELHDWLDSELRFPGSDHRSR